MYAKVKEPRLRAHLTNFNILFWEAKKGEQVRGYYITLKLLALLQRYKNKRKILIFFEAVSTCRLIAAYLGSFRTNVAKANYIVCRQGVRPSAI